MATDNDRDDLEEEVETEDEDVNDENEELEDEDSDESVSLSEYKKLQEHVQKLQKAQHKTNKEAQKRRQQLKKFEDAGYDPDQALELAKKADEYEHNQAKKQGNVEKLTQQLEEKYNGKINELNEKLTTKDKALRDVLVSDRLNQAMNDLGAVTGASKALIPYAERFINVQEEDGKYNVVVLDEDGDPRWNPDGSYMGIKEFLQELRTDDVWSNFFQQSNHSGTGSTSGNSKAKGGGKNAPKSKANMSPQDKVAYIAENGRDAYLALK